MREKLLGLVAQDRLPHACVLESGTAEERMVLAKDLAKALVCKNGANRPCNTCDACRKADSGNHPDILYVGPENGRKTISVETVRNMRDNAYVLPNEADRKVYIIDPADTMQDYAQNALLKILDVPAPLHDKGVSAPDRPVPDGGVQPDSRRRRGPERRTARRGERPRGGTGKSAGLRERDLAAGSHVRL